MSEFRDRYKHEREVARKMLDDPMSPQPMRAAEDLPFLMQAENGREYFSPEYVEWLEQKVAELDNHCREQAEMLYQDPTLLDRRK